MKKILLLPISVILIFALCLSSAMAAPVVDCSETSVDNKDISFEENDTIDVGEIQHVSAETQSLLSDSNNEAFIPDVITARADDYELDSVGLYSKSSDVADEEESVIQQNVAQAKASSKQLSGRFSMKVLKRSISNASSKIELSVMINNGTKSNKSPIMYYAIYNAKGVMVSLVSNQGEILSGETKIFDVTVDMSEYDPGKYTEKIYLWDESMNILASSINLGTSTLEDTSNKIVISNKNLTLYMNDGLNRGSLTARVYPSSFSSVGVHYFSADPEIALVTDYGVIQAISVGTTTIYAISEDSGAYSSCEVVVQDYITTSVTLSHSGINMLSNTSYFLYLNAYPVQSATAVWASSDSSIASVNQFGKITAYKKGTVTITATVNNAKATCCVNVYQESDYIGKVAAYYESLDRPGTIGYVSGDIGGKSYGCFQFASGSDVPREFYNWLIDTGYNTYIGYSLRDAHNADGGYDCTYGTNFDYVWKQLANNDTDNFKSCQYAFTKARFYDGIVSKLKDDLGFDINNYGFAIKNAIWSRAVQHGTGGVIRVVTRAFNNIGGFSGKSEIELIDAIYNESSAIVYEAPATTSNIIGYTDFSIANGIAGTYMKYFSGCSSDVQISVWNRIYYNERDMIYDIYNNPPIYITPQD